MRLKFVFFGVLISLSTNIYAASPLKYIWASISGMDASPNIQDLASVRETISEFVRDLKVKEYKLVAMGSDGGFYVCVLPWSDTDATVMWLKINGLPMHPRETIYSTGLADDCAE